MSKKLFLLNIAAIELPLLNITELFDKILSTNQFVHLHKILLELLENKMAIIPSALLMDLGVFFHLHDVNLNFDGLIDVSPNDDIVSLPCTEFDRAKQLIEQFEADINSIYFVSDNNSLLRKSIVNPNLVFFVIIEDDIVCNYVLEYYRLK